jgi:hypothetical protein
MGTDELRMQQRAVEALEESTKTLKVADQLLRVGNYREAERLQAEAREQRKVSVQLLAQALHRQRGH